MYVLVVYEMQVFIAAKAAWQTGLAAQQTILALEQAHIFTAHPEGIDLDELVAQVWVGGWGGRSEGGMGVGAGVGGLWG